LIAIAGFLMMVGGHASPQERAKIIFICIGIVSLGFVMFAGVFQTADCLSEERREGTLGLLFLTDLKGYDVVLGKLSSTSLHSVYTFLAIVPVLALPLLMGGVTGGEFWRVTLVLLVALYLSLGVGMFISAFSREARGAMGGTFLVMLVLAGAMPVLGWAAVVGGWTSGLKVLLWASPPYAFQRAFDNYYSMGPGKGVFWSCIAMMLGIGTAGLLAASLLLPRLWQESGNRQSAKSAGRPASWRLWSPPNTHFEKRKLRGDQPFFWLATRDARPQRIAAWAFAILLPLWLYVFVELLPAPRNRGPAIGLMLMLFLTYAMHVILKCFVAVEATRRFSEDRQSGALELLLVTPLPISEIIASQARGVWHSFRWGYAILTLMNLALLWFFMGSVMFGNDSETAGIAMLMMVGGIIVLYLDGFALVKIGMWMSLVKKRQSLAFLATVLRVLLPAWLLVVFFIFMGFVGAFRGGPGTGQGMIFAWFFIGGVVAVVGMASASSNLELNFREVASLGRLESRPNFSGITPSLPTPLTE
jgi:ABC-type transport system involved in cytochrome c biogenesis permease component